MGPTLAMTVGAVAAGAAGVAGVVAAGVRRSTRPSPAGDGRRRRLALEVGVVAAVVASILVATHVVVVARGVTSSWFTAVHVAYLGAVVTAPIVGAGSLVATVATRRSWRPALAALALLVPAPVGWYATHRAPFAIEVDRAETALPAARVGQRALHVGVLADLQTSVPGAYEHRAISLLLAEEPDVIVIPGDLFQGDGGQFERALPRLRVELRRLRAPGGVYAVRGDSDTGDRLDRLVEGSDVEILDDEVVRVRIGDRRVAIGGNALLWAPPPAVEVRAELMGSSPAEVRILVSHRPDVVLLLPPRSGVDLVVSGHTHGGQVALPGIGPLETFSTVSRAVGAGGLHEVEGNPIYVSTGVGIVREQAPQLRFLTRPSVGLVTLR